MTDPAWIDAALVAARPRAVGALLRYFRELDLAEEAFQDACLKALQSWPVKGPPRDPAAWLIFVGRNAGVDGLRRRGRQTALPDEAALSDLDDVETPLAERLDGADYRDDVLRLMFVCCHPDLPATQQIALALRIVSGLSVRRIARAFLVGEAAMEQRITRAKARIAAAGLPFDTPGPLERPSGWGSSWPWSIWSSTKDTRPPAAPMRTATTGPVWRARPSAWADCCCACSRQSRR